MKTQIDRRNMLKVTLASVGAGAIGASLPFKVYAQSAVELTVTRLSDNIVMISGAGGNVVAAKAGDGVVLVDGGLEAHVDDVLNLAASELGSDNFHTLFNTHWHPQQTGANKVLAARGTNIIAQANTKLWLSTDITPPYENKTYQPLPAEAQPSETFYTSGEKTFGDTTVQYGYLLQAHTDGDAYVYFPGDNVLVAGGPVSSEGWPYMDWWTGGWIAGLADGLSTLAAVANADTKVIPANGGVMTKADLEEQAAMYSDLFQKLRTDLYSGLSPAESVAKNHAAPYVGKMGDPDLFLTLSFQSMWGHFSPDA